MIKQIDPTAEALIRKFLSQQEIEMPSTGSFDSVGSSEAQALNSADHSMDTKHQQLAGASYWHTNEVAETNMRTHGSRSRSSRRQIPKQGPLQPGRIHKDGCGFIQNQ